MIALAGFELDASHVLEEQIDHVMPAVTASDVVDRETLKAFVTEAGEFFAAIQECGDPAAFPKARSAMRDPDGPWRHGSVYLYVLDLFSITTCAHGITVAGSALAVSATGAPSDTVHFAYRPTVPPDEAFTYLGAAFTREETARFAWDILDLAAGGYELVALYTQGEDDAITYDSIEVTVDNDADAPDIAENRERKTQALLADERNEIVTANRVVVTLPEGALAMDDRITIAVSDPPETRQASHWRAGRKPSTRK